MMQTIQMAVASRQPDGTLRVSAVVDGKIVLFTIAPHVAASVVATLAAALAAETS